MVVTARIARICWNANGWRRPSGRRTRPRGERSFSTDPDHGYGYEEWLNDGRLLDGWKYGFVQAIPKLRAALDGHEGALHLVSRRPDGGWEEVAFLRRCQPLSRHDAREALARMVGNGSVDEMISEIEAAGEVADHLRKTVGEDPLDIINVRFWPKDMEMLHKELVAGHPFAGRNLCRYTNAFHLHK